MSRLQPVNRYRNLAHHVSACDYFVFQCGDQTNFRNSKLPHPGPDRHVINHQYLRTPLSLTDSFAKLTWAYFPLASELNRVNRVVLTPLF